MIKFTVFGDLHFDEVADGNKRVSELVELDVELYDFRWNGVSIKPQTSSQVISTSFG